MALVSIYSICVLNIENINPKHANCLLINRSLRNDFRCASGSGGTATDT